MVSRTAFAPARQLTNERRPQDDLHPTCQGPQRPRKRIRRGEEGDMLIFRLAILRTHNCSPRNLVLCDRQGASR